MLQKSPALVLSCVKYGDSSVIVKAYTREQGLKSFISGGLQTKKGPLRPALIQPLSQLQLVYYDKGKSELKRIKEASVYQAYDSIFYNPIKSGLAMFLAEFLSHVLKEEETNFQLFDFLSKSILYLDVLEEGLGNFHLYFMMELSYHLGFRPEPAKEGATYFDLQNGIYSTSEPPHLHFIKAENIENWKALQGLTHENLAHFKMSKQSREILLKEVLEYYRLHLNDFGNLRSLDVLKTLFS